jgi:hypothetical protein
MGPTVRLIDASSDRRSPWYHHRAVIDDGLHDVAIEVFPCVAMFHANALIDANREFGACGDLN